MHKILITGASGYLAHRLMPIAAIYGQVVGIARCAESVYKPAQAISLDLCDTVAIKRIVEEVKPSAIIHAAAANPSSGDEMMDVINHHASAALANVAIQCGIRLVMVSTESVHSGNAAPYTDHAVPDPINAYGQSKADGEQAVLDIDPESIVVRTSLIYGLTEIDHGTDGFRNRLARGEPLALFDDVLRQPIWADSLSHALCKLATEFTDVSGTMNVVGDEVMSRAEFALVMMKQWDIEAGSNVSFRSGAGIKGVQMDLRCSCELAKSLGFSLPGVSEVLLSAKQKDY